MCFDFIDASLIKLVYIEMQTEGLIPTACQIFVLFEADVHRKSGTWKQVPADSGVITEKYREYILVVPVEDKEGGERLVELISVADEFLDSRAGQQTIEGLL